MDTQNDTRKPGPFQITAGVDLTGMEGKLAKMTNSSGAARAVLPTGVGDVADLLILDGGASGTDVSVVVTDRSAARRVRLSGTCNAGDELTNGAIGTGTTGTLRTTPGTTGTYFVGYRAEEKGVDGQMLLVREIANARSVVVA